MSWKTTRRVEFAHVDAAGIVFYPRYFELINSVIEEFFASHVNYAFAPMHFDDHKGVPTVSISIEFPAPSRLGDKLNFDLRFSMVGTTSATLEMTCFVPGQTRFVAKQVLVRMDLKTGKSEPWPDAVRQKLESA